MSDAKHNASQLYLYGIRDGHPREAVTEYTGSRYTQHSTGVADGPEGFIAFFEPFIARNPVRDIQIIRALQEGRHVFIHAYQSLNNGESVWITTDFFDSDDAGKIIEHWDVIGAGTPPNASGRTQTGGSTEITDRDKTQANKDHVLRFVQECLIERNLDRIHEFMDGQQFLQHATDLPDGLAAFVDMYGAPDCPLSYQECFMAVAEGNFVATLNRARRDGQDLCLVDLYRLESGLIVEHWDNAEPVPPREEWANSGKF